MRPGNPPRRFPINRGMTLSATYQPAQFTGTGLVSTYAFNFKVIAKTHLKVVKLTIATSVEVTLAVDTDYTVAGVGAASGSITLTAGNLPATHKITIARNAPYSQETDLRNQTGYFPDTLEDRLDLTTMQVQQVMEQSNRALQLALSIQPGTVNPALPVPAASTVVGWDSNGTALVNYPISAAAIGVPTDGTVTTAKIVDGAVTLAKLNAALVLPVAQGGTGSTTAAAARTALGLGTAAVLNVGTGASQVVQLTAAAKLPAVDGSLLTNLAGGLSLAKCVLLQDQKSSGTAAGTFTAGAWQTRVLNTEVSDTGGICALAANQFTLDAGTYLVYATAPFNSVGKNRLRLQNTTGAATLLQGGTDREKGCAVMAGVFTVAASQALELQHYSAVTQLTDGFGEALTTGAVEVYASVLLVKIA